MARTTVNVNEALLDRARRALGTSGLSETLNAALEEVVARDALADFDVADFDITDEDIRPAREDLRL